MIPVSERLYNAAAVRGLDAQAIALSKRPDAGYALMRQAGSAVLEASRERYPSSNAWLVLCGAGNNAGDGYVVAREASHFGVEVTLLALTDPAELTGDAALAAQAWLDEGGEVQLWPAKIPGHINLVIDALLGTGLDRPVTGAYREAIEAINGVAAPCVAVDIPSGLSADTGQVMGQAVRADLTITFIGRKQGMVTNAGPDHCGVVRFARLDVPKAVYESNGDFGRLLGNDFLAQHLRPRQRDSHKGTYGHVALVAGQEGMGGAARLAGEGALRAGAGLCTVFTHPTHAAVINSHRPELMAQAVDGEAALQGSWGRANALAVGPGLGSSAWAEGLLMTCLGDARPLVVDADALNLLAEQPRQRQNWILTPHPKEAARLLATELAAIQADRVASALALSDKFQAVVVLKGAGTVLANPEGDWAICGLGNPGMATAGSGDVLTGVIAAFLAQGFAPWLAAQLGVTAHAAAGDHAAMRGERGLLALDIADALRSVVNPPAGAP